MLEADTILRDEVRQQNTDSLSALMGQYNITLPVREFATWRPTKRERDELKGLPELGAVEILCTNGVLAVFLLHDGQTLYGHVSNFMGKVRPLHSVPPPAKETKPKANRPGAKVKSSGAKSRSSRITQASVDAAMELLNQLIKQNGKQD